MSSSTGSQHVTELETLAVVWALDKFHTYLYGQSVTVITDHSAVRAVLETPNPSCKHARWWAKVYSAGLKDIRIIYRVGRLNSSADALSRGPLRESPTAEDSGQISSVQSVAVSEPDPTREDSATIPTLLTQPPVASREDDFGAEQRKDPELMELITYLEEGKLPSDDQRARQITLQKSLFTIENGMLFYLDPKQSHHRRVAVPSHLRQQLGGHFASKKTYGALVRHRDVCRYSEVHQELPPVHSSHRRRTASPVATAPYSSQPPLSDCGRRHNGATEDRSRESVCASLSGLPHEMAPSISDAGPEESAHS